MNKLNETSSAKPRLLSDGDLTQVVGGYGHHRWGGGNHDGNHGRNGGHGNGNGNGSSLARKVVFITVNNTTINNFL
jgi:hypothetical protein